MLRATNRTVHRARKLRREMSLPEILLWRELQKRPTGLKFRKQHPAGELALDFFCASAKLAIEVDGKAHDHDNQAAFDQKRDAWLRLHGIETLRVMARDILADIEPVVVHITEAARSRLPLHQPAAGPPPRSGEDFEG